MLQVLHSSMAVIFLLAAIVELVNGHYRRPLPLRHLAVTTAILTGGINAWSVFEIDVRYTALLWTVGVLVSYTGFLRIEARLWTFEADCGCLGRTSGSIRTAILRNTAMSAGLAVVAIIQKGAESILLLPIVIAGYAVGLLVTVILGPTRFLAIQSEHDDIGNPSTPTRLLALNSRCEACVQLALKFAKRPLPMGIDGVLTDHTMRVTFYKDVHRYRPTDLSVFAQLPTPCLVDLREDGAVTGIKDFDDPYRRQPYSNQHVGESNG